ncbi:MAG TPA: TIGR02270 family protein [Vicinamibacterales bacterium]|jgi:uncharacterized protein (TIGR02270 family)
MHDRIRPRAREVPPLPPSRPASSLHEPRRSRIVIPAVVHQHAEETASLFVMRSPLTAAPHARLDDLQRLDKRLAAHLDGLAVAGEHAWRVCESTLETPSAGAMFAAVAWALQNARHTLDPLFTLAQSSSPALQGLIAAFGWVERGQLEGLVAQLLVDDDRTRRETGMAACASHRVDPGVATGEWLRDADAAVRARALRAAGEIGVPEAISECLQSLDDDDEDCRFWSAWSVTLLGDRRRALDYLTRLATTPSRHAPRASRLALQAHELHTGHEVLSDAARNPQLLTWVVRGSGIVGDPMYAPWLIGQMANARTARAAGEAFTIITGLDLSMPPYERAEAGPVDGEPNDDPDDSNVEMDADDRLPWPDADRVRQWWEDNQSRFVMGRRYFMGAPVTREHCIDVLKHGRQRQRSLAAHHLCLLEAGTPLFNTAAPAWRQERWLREEVSIDHVASR